MLDLLATLGHEIIVFHLMAENELNLDYSGYTSLKDLETGQTIRFDATQAASQYQQNLERYLAGIRTQMLDRNIYYRLLTMGKPLEVTLRDFLNQRTKIKV